MEITETARIKGTTQNANKFPKSVKHFPCAPSLFMPHAREHPASRFTSGFSQFVSQFIFLSFFGARVFIHCFSRSHSLSSCGHRIKHKLTLHAALRNFILIYFQFTFSHSLPLRLTDGGRSLFRTWFCGVQSLCYPALCASVFYHQS